MIFMIGNSQDSVRNRFSIFQKTKYEEKKEAGHINTNTKAGLMCRVGLTDVPYGKLENCYLQND